MLAQARKIIAKVMEGGRLDRDEALYLLGVPDLLLLGRAADSVRRRFCPEPVVTFVADCTINYTNVCTCGCRFCAFFRPPSHPEAYFLTRDEVLALAADAVGAGVTQIMLQGGLAPQLTLDYCLEILQALKENLPVHLHCFSPPEIAYLAEKSGLGLREVIRRLKEAGLDSIPGGGAEILEETVRKTVSPKKISADQWLAVMREAHGLGLRSTATMMFGAGETMEQRVEHLERIRELQDETGGFTAFIPWTFEPGGTALGGKKADALDYLRTVAVSRLYLDNIPHVQASWVTQGPKIAQLALTFGADDFGGTVLGERVVRAAGARYGLSFEEIVGLIRAAGYRPAQRTTDYRIIKYF